MPVAVVCDSVSHRAANRCSLTSGPPDLARIALQRQPPAARRPARPPIDSRPHSSSGARPPTTSRRGRTLPPTFPPATRIPPMHRRKLDRRGACAGCRLARRRRVQAFDETHHGHNARYRASLRPWHGRYYNVQYGQAVSVVVPPTAELTTDYGWGSVSSRMTRNDHQFQRPWPAQRPLDAVRLPADAGLSRATRGSSATTTSAARGSARRGVKISRHKNRMACRGVVVIPPIATTPFFARFLCA